MNLHYKRIMLKLSGEALMGSAQYGMDPDVIQRLASEIHDLSMCGTEIGLVIGGGNILRGAGMAAGGMDRVTADHMGMLATVMNALAMQDALIQAGASCRVLSALEIRQVCEHYDRRTAVQLLREGFVTIFAAGTGNPFFTTDSAASLRAIETGAEIMLKATKVDGVYSADPVGNPDARRYEWLTYDQAIREKLMVMDTTALVLCRDHDLPCRVFNIFEPGNLTRVVEGQAVGTLVEREHRE